MEVRAPYVGGLWCGVRGRSGDSEALLIFACLARNDYRNGGVVAGNPLWRHGVRVGVGLEVACGAAWVLDRLWRL
eukprot:GDKH01025148.1.p4 GENE.GDKH01025148.1~~GDKH01025148.1.p4  ORF type:complete len:75 (-),score=1.39 GDKH01025148.1:228-452(-)